MGNGSALPPHRPRCEHRLGHGLCFEKPETETNLHWASCLREGGPSPMEHYHRFLLCSSSTGVLHDLWAHLKATKHNKTGHPKDSNHARVPNVTIVSLRAGADDFSSWHVPGAQGGWPKLLSIHFSTCLNTVAS